MLSSESVETLKLIYATVATLVPVAALIWTITWAIRSPRLKLSLLDTRGDIRPYGEGPQAPKAHFYHVRVENRTKWTATNVRVKIARMVVSRSPGTGLQLIPACLIWTAHPLPKIYLKDVAGLDEDACNLGYIKREDNKFNLDAMDPARFAQNYKWPPLFEGFLNPGDKMHVELVAIADNAKSNVLYLQIAWDGQWHDASEEMEKHVLITKISQSTFSSF